MKTVQGAGLDHGAPNWASPAASNACRTRWRALTPGPEGGQVSGVGIAGVNEINTHNPNAEPYGSETDGMPSQVFMANTLEELLGYLGYEGEALQTALDEIARYNELCHAGRDADFGKEAALMIPVEEAPFYGAVQQNDGSTSTGLVTLAGLVTDENLNVMKLDRSEPIKGLYAAGNTVGQRYGHGLCHAQRGQLHGHGDDPRLHGRQDHGSPVRNGFPFAVLATSAALVRPGPRRTPPAPGAFSVMAAPYCVLRRRQRTWYHDARGRRRAQRAGRTPATMERG